MSAEDTAVVFVHGLWMTGLESFALRHHVLVHHGWQWRTFHYHSVGQHHDEVVRALDAAVQRLGARRVHLVGHSLGGLVIYQALQAAPDWPPGRVVFLGTPSLGSLAAERFREWPFGEALLGHAVDALLDPLQRHWCVPRELGIIAGSDSFSLGRLVADFDGEANDGMVAVYETRLPGATAHLTLPASHTGMMFSSEVAQQVCAFLDTGQFRT